MMRRIVIIWFAMIAASASAAVVKCFVFAGQSNAGGKAYCDCALTSVGIPASNGAVFFYGSASNFTTLYTPNDASNGYGYGPEMSAAPAIVNAFGSGACAIAKAVVGGTYITQWMAGAGANCWTVWTARVLGLGLALSNAGHTVEWAGLVWYQGENESLLQANATNYYTRLTNLIQSHRLYLGTNCHAYIVTIAPSDVWTYRASITAAQWQASATLTNCHTVESDATDWTDNQHPAAHATVRTGQNVGMAIKQVFGP